LASFAHKSFAQDSLVGAKINQLYKVWDAAYLAGQNEDKPISMDELFSYYDRQTIDTSQQTQLYADMYLLKSEYLRKETGLSITGNYLENIGTAFGDLEDNAFYHRRFQMGLKWDLLKGGFLSSRNQSEQAKIQAELEKLRPNKHVEKENYIKKWHELSYHFNTLKVDLLKSREKLIDTTTNVANELHFLGYFSKEELIKLYTKQAEISSLIDVYQAYNSEYVKLAAAPSISNELPLLDVLPLVFGIDSLWNDDTKDSLIAKEMELVELENKWLHDVSLSPFLRYNYYDLVAPANYRSFMSAGLNFSLPIPFNNKAEKAYLEAKVKAKYEEIDESSQLLRQDALTVFYEYRYKLKQYISFHYKAILLKEMLRQEQARKEISPLRFNPVDAIQILDELTAVELEMIDLKQNMYLKILRLQLALNNPDAKYIFHAINLEKIEEQKSNLELYCWSAAINEFSAAKIFGFTELNNIKSALLSLPKESASNARYRSFLELAQGRDLNVKFMIGDNNLFKKVFAEEMNSRLQGISSEYYSEIHLDVEPHTFDDWKANQSSYLNEYLIMLREARKWCDENGKKLSVSIPLHYPEATIKDIFELCDRVYFMAYENIKTDYIVRKAQAYDRSKTVIALRTNDFLNRLEMENKIDELENAGFNQFIYHDFKSLYSLK
jgi:hypothetical protein